MYPLPGITARYGKPPAVASAVSAPVKAGSKRKDIKNWKSTLKRIWSYMARYKLLLALVLLLAVTGSVLSLASPYLLGVAVDKFLVNGSGKELVLLLAVLGGVYLIQTGAVLLQNYFMIGVAQNTVAAIRQDLFGRLHKLPIPFYASRQHGELMSRFTNDMDNVSQTLSNSFIQLFSSVVTFTGMLSFMLWLSPVLTVVTLTIVPVMFFGMKWITARTGKLFKDQQRDMGELNGLIEETLSGQLIVKAYSKEEKVISAFESVNGRLRISAYWAQTFSGFISKLMILLNNMSFAVIAAVGSLLALHDLVTIGLIITFTEYARQFVRPLNDLAAQVNTLLSAVAGAERAFDIMDVEEEKDAEDAVELDGVQGEIEFSHVTFSYVPGAETLSDIDFHIQPGQTVALVGPTGAGKSTIVQVITRFYELDRGWILIDGKDIKTIKRDSLRRSLGFVLQDSVLFNDTIRENIRYGRLDASDEEVEEAAKLANAHSFITKLPNGYDHHLRQGGSGISHGQKQLLAIARAILADPAILILDEATSSIDTVTEIKIQEALVRLMKGRTNVIIAHRLNTIRQADLILVLDNGRIIERGSHESLLRQKGFYYDLYEAKNKSSSLA